jgi:hypothetical protein
MLRKTHIIPALLTASLLLAPTLALTPAQADTGPPTVVEVTLPTTVTTGMVPAVLNGAEVDVFYEPANPPESYDAPLMGTGTTDASGNVLVTLNTSMVTDAGDVGDGNGGAFNADILAIWGTGVGGAAETNAVLEVGSTTHVQMSPDPNETVTPNLSGTPSAVRRHVGSGHSYVPVVAENSGGGIHTDFLMTHTTSTDRQTRVQAAISVDGTAPFTVGSFWEEQTGRNYSIHWKVDQGYHKFVWANYGFWKWNYQTCGIRGCVNAKYRWLPHDWTGDLTDDNTDPPCNGCKGKVGKVDYNVPPMTTKRDNTVVLDTHTSPIERDTSITKTYGFSLDFAGFVSVDSKATYGNITSVTWTYLSAGCSSSGYQRLLWGNGYTVTDAPIVQASCAIRPS